MTTTVHVLVQGNKACEVKVVLPDGSNYSGVTPRTIKPQEWTTVSIHGDQSVKVTEVGAFL
jgi:hypothetical protein